MKNFLKTTGIAAAILTSSQAYCYQLPGRFLVEAGAYTTSSGKNQNVGISGLIGDRYSVTDRYDGAPVFGVGYLVEGIQQDKFGVDYGVNVYYLAKTKVSGTITQEQVYTNLAYNYYLSHLPIYAVAKAYFNTSYHNMAVTLDAGIGPNFLDVSGYRDWAIDSITLPDNAFSGHTNVVLSAMAGIGVKGEVMQVPVELGYRFFYLGESSLNTRTSQILNKLNTGNIYAHALVLTLSV